MELVYYRILFEHLLYAAHELRPRAVLRVSRTRTWTLVLDL